MMNFERGKEPKEALEIGLFSKRHFDSLLNARKWLVQNHVKILGLDGLCYPYPTEEQFANLRAYVEKYISYSDDESWTSDSLVNGVAQLYRELHEVRNSIGNIMNGNNR